MGDKLWEQPNQNFLRNLEKTIAFPTHTHSQQSISTGAEAAEQNTKALREILGTDAQRVIDQLTVDSINKANVSGRYSQEWNTAQRTEGINIMLDMEVREFEYVKNGAATKVFENGHLLTDTEMTSLLSELTQMEIMSQETANGLLLRKILDAWLSVKTMASTQESNSASVTSRGYGKSIAYQDLIDTQKQLDTQYQQLQLTEPLKLSEGSRVNRVGMEPSTIYHDDLADTVAYVPRSLRWK